MAEKKRWAPAELQLLLDRRLSSVDIAQMTGRSTRSVNHKRRRLGTCGKETWTEEDVKYLLDNLGKVYYDEMDLPHSTYAIHKKVQRLGLKQHGVRCPMCRSLPVIGYFNKRHSGLCQRCSQARRALKVHTSGRWLDNNGYVRIALAIIPDDELPFARQVRDGMNGSIHEHRWVMAKHLGRPLERTEIVHHRNGDKTDNRLENLQLFSSKEHHWGFGDFYQQWQEALAECRRLEQLLAQKEDGNA
jgi:hypothetical protein